MTSHPDDDRADGAGTDDDAVPTQPDTLTGASPESDEIASADPDRQGDETDPYELRSGIQASPSDDDPGSMLGR
jgi:hypothetical protein